MSDRTRTRLLNALKVSGARTAADLAREQEVTPVAVRQHLDSLLSDGLVEYEDIKGSVGRPKRMWMLTATGHSQFPDNHSGLILGLLGGMKELYGAEGLDRLIAHREHQAFQIYSTVLEGKISLSDKLEALAELRTREGYMACVEQDGEDYLLIENHCSICAAAKTCQGFCRSEMSLFQSLLGDNVGLTRDEHILSGGRRCVYRVSQERAGVA